MLRDIFFYVVGVIFSLAVCFSLVLMVYLLRRTLNMVELAREHRHNDTQPSLMRLLSARYNDSQMDLNIESPYLAPLIGCNFCYFLVWSNISCLLLCYPLYFL